MTGSSAFRWRLGVGSFDEMSITAEEKTKIVSDYKIHEKDTGSPEVQIAILTKRINELTDHLRTHKKDHSSALSICGPPARVVCFGGREKDTFLMQPIRVERQIGGRTLRIETGLLA